MTRDDVRHRRDPAQSVVDVLTDLFDSVAPSDRAAAEEELREAGIDPAAVGTRIARLTASSSGAQTGPARPARSPAGTPRRAAAAPIGERRRRRVSGAWARAAAALLLEIAIGWLFARGAAPPPPQAHLARGARANPDEPPAPAAGWYTRTDSPGRPGHEQASDAGQLGAPAGEQLLGSAGREEPAAATESAPAPEGGPAAQVEPAPVDARGITDAGADAGAVTDEAAAEGGGATEAWQLDAGNWSAGKHLLPDPVLEHVRKGEYHFTVQPLAPAVFRRSYSRDFWGQTEANAGRYGIDPSTCGLKDAARGEAPSFFFGFPFPSVARDDPVAGCRIMWNALAASAIGGGQEASLTMDQLAPGSVEPLRRMQLQLYDKMFVGRQSGPTPNPAGLRSVALVQTTAPSDLAGTSSLTQRSNQATARDKIWAYVPTLRRVRAVSPANRSDGLLGSDLSLDEFECFDGKLEDFDWRVVGTATILAPLTSIRPSTQVMLTAARTEIPLPSPRAAFEVQDAAGAPWLIVDGLVTSPRPVWVVEGVPHDKYYLVGKIVLYVDRELFRVYWRLAYSWQGEYVGHTMCVQHWSRSVDAMFASATATALTAVNERRPRATLGRFTSQILDETQRDELFTIEGLSQLAH